MTDDQLSPAELRVIRGLGLTPEVFLARKKQIAEGREPPPTVAERVQVLRDMALTASPREREALLARARLLEED